MRKRLKKVKMMRRMTRMKKVERARVRKEVEAEEDKFKTEKGKRVKDEERIK